MKQGKTISEKILAKAAGKSEVTPGDYISLTTTQPVPIPLSVTGDGLGRGAGQIVDIGAEKLFDPMKVILIDDHPGVTASHGIEEGRVKFLDWARKYGVPESNIFRMGRNGIGHIVAPEKGWALPGTLYLSVTNGHTPSVGGIGCFAATLSYESGAYLLTGYTWQRVPETVEFSITGKLQEGVMARDIFEYVLNDIGPAGAPFQVMEWTGPVIDNMSMDGRFSLCCNVLFTGAETGIINPDGKTIDYAKSRTKQSFEPLTSDPDAVFAKKYQYDVSNLEPQIVPPPKRYISKSVNEFLDVQINRAFIGSCSNARLEDMRIAAKILEGNKIHSNVRLNITHGSVEILRESVQEGLFEIFIDSEAEMPSPCCGMCYGQNTPLATGDVCISTGTCNYDGRMGSRNSKIFLANPATVAASAIEGKITDPREYL